MEPIRELLTDFALVGAAVLFAAWLLLVSRGRIARAADALAKVSLTRLAVFLAFVAVAAIHGGAKNGATNEPPRGASNGRVERFDGRVERVEGSDESTRSTCSTWLNTSTPFSRLESETTNETYSYAMPVNATRYEKWWRRGAYEDVFELDLDGLLFPFGECLCDSLWVYSWGMAGRSLADVSNRVVAAGVPMSAVPGVSRFWSAEAADGGKILTWENFFLNRNTNTPVSAQLELRPSGDYIARSNLVERLYRRVNPDDWDDDGVPNDDDLALKPLDVNFSFIMVEEVPSAAGSRTGYFSHQVFASLQSHTRENGAGIWRRPDDNNFYATDYVCVTSSIPRITPGGILTNDAQFGWADGEIFWEVPSGWGELGSVDLDPPEGRFAEDTTHRVVIFADGKCGIRKLLHQVTRSTNDVVVLDGVVK